MMVIITIRHKRLEQCKAWGPHSWELRLRLWKYNSDLLRLQCDLLGWPKSIWCGHIANSLPLWDVSHWWSDLKYDLLPSYSLQHSNTTSPTITGVERFSKIQNLHSSLFKQHLFSNDRSTLRGERESIFNWMFTWGILQPYGSDYWTICTSALSGCLSLWSNTQLSKLSHKNLQRRNKTAWNLIKSTPLLLEKPKTLKTGDIKHTYSFFQSCKHHRCQKTFSKQRLWVISY